MFNLSEKVIEFGSICESEITDIFKSLDDVSFKNQCRVLNAFKENKLSTTHFNGTTGYGYDDLGRDVIEKIYSQVFDCEDALVRHNFMSGTHTLSTALFGILRPNDIMLSVSGIPYDTLLDTIGINSKEDMGSLKEFGIKYDQIDLIDGKEFNYNEVQKYLDENKVKMIYIQRSKGYLDRVSLSISQIQRLCKFVKNIDDSIIIMVDNCYGEFVEEKEPTSVGADIIAGSLIKNPGGGIATTGGYIAGKKELIEKISYRLTCPGIGKEIGCTQNQNIDIIKGLFYAPHTVKEALKTAILAAKVYDKLGFEVNPLPNEKRTDIIEAIKFKDENKVIAFCEGIQFGSPIDSYVTPVPWEMPGYEDKVIMAAGTFTQGASIELSADAPIKEPYIAYFQGGLTYESGKIGILSSLQNMVDKGLVEV